ncbi:MAG: dihydrofolate reductase family protein [Candidatus Eremiobacteraeota bacterium]|nr:dihydrofolate reductase family protein [Candidatus Eremiobacteraeota bacterium]
MSKLIYITNMSLDGYVEDDAGSYDLGNPDEVFSLITDLLRSAGTYLYGRKMYETMAYWESPQLEGNPSEHREFARIWQAAQKIVFSRAMTERVTRNTRFERDFNAEAIRKIKDEVPDDITIGGSELASRALETDLVDECHLFVYPIVIGGGKPAFHKPIRRRLELVDMRRFSTGVTYLRYRLQCEA